jgi:hypothetical protein
VWIDALTQKVREGGRTVNVHCLVATGVNADGHREILGVDVTSSEDGAGWLAFLRGLVARGLTGVALVTSDDHVGLVSAIGSVLPGAAWQRCRTHYADLGIMPTGCMPSLVMAWRARMPIGIIRENKRSYRRPLTRIPDRAHSICQRGCLRRPGTRHARLPSGSCRDLRGYADTREPGKPLNWLNERMLCITSTSA